MLTTRSNIRMDPPVTHEYALISEVDIRVTRGRWGRVFQQIICRRLSGGSSSNAVFVYGLSMNERRVSIRDGSIFSDSLAARVKRHREGAGRNPTLSGCYHPEGGERKRGKIRISGMQYSLMYPLPCHTALIYLCTLSLCQREEEQPGLILR